MRSGVAVYLVLVLAGCRQPHQPLADDDRVSWLRTHATRVRTVDPTDIEFSDLEPLGARIADTRVVMLGEPSHGDGTAFLAKDRLVRFLHERKGFDVLAWESGLFDCERMNKALSDPHVTSQEVASLGVFRMWAQSAQVVPVFDYVRATQSTQRPMVMAGFDPQVSAADPSQLYDAIRSDLDEAVPGLLDARRADALRTAFGRFPKEHEFRSLTPAERDTDRRLLHELLDAIPAGSSVLRHEITNVIALYDWHEVRSAGGSAPLPLGKNIAVNNIRDRVMAENLLWMLKLRFPTKKVIVWAANWHTMRSIERIERPFVGVMTMGQLVYDDLGTSMYSIALTAYGGRAGQAGRPDHAITPAPVGSFEDLLHRLGSPIITVGLRGLPTDSDWRLFAQPLGYEPSRGDWQRSFDELFVIDDMTPSTSALVSIAPTTRR